MNRHRARNGEINRKHGNTEVKTFRGIYGTTFALGFTQNAKLSDALMMLDEGSLSKLVQDHEAGILEEKLNAADAARVRSQKFSAR
jgi:hypothetical protein